jgi:hypothetical protein
MATKRKMTTAKPVAKKPVTPASKAAATDKMKKQAAENPKPGTIIAKPNQSKATSGQDMRATQIQNAKKKSDEWSKRHGGLPRTAANVKKYGN